MAVFLNQLNLTPKVNWANLHNAKKPIKPNGNIRQIITPKITPIIANYEGYRDTAYKPVPSDPWTIGYGSTRINGKPVVPGQKITKAEAQRALQNHIEVTAKEVQGMVKKPLKPNQLAALTSFAYNTGTGALKGSTLLKHINTGNFTHAASEFMKWTKDGSGQSLGGLVTRRKLEQKLFNGGFAAIGR